MPADSGWATVVLSAVVSFFAGVMVMLWLQPQKQPEELLLAIVRAGQSFPSGYGAHVSAGVKAGEDLAIYFAGNQLLVRPLVRAADRCGAPEPLDPSPENIFTACTAMLVIGAAERDQHVRNLGLMGGQWEDGIRIEGEGQ